MGSVDRQMSPSARLTFACSSGGKFFLKICSAPAREDPARAGASRAPVRLARRHRPRPYVPGAPASDCRPLARPPAGPQEPRDGLSSCSTCCARLIVPLWFWPSLSSFIEPERSVCPACLRRASSTSRRPLARGPTPAPRPRARGEGGARVPPPSGRKSATWFVQAGRPARLAKLRLQLGAGRSQRRQAGSARPEARVLAKLGNLPN